MSYTLQVSCVIEVYFIKSNKDYRMYNYNMNN